MASASEKLIFEILLKSAKSLEELAKLDKSTSDYSSKLDKLSKSMMSLSELSGMSWTAIERGLEKITVKAGTTSAQFERLKAVIQDLRAISTSIQTSPTMGGGQGVGVNQQGQKALPPPSELEVIDAEVIDGEVYEDVADASRRTAESSKSTADSAKSTNASMDGVSSSSAKVDKNVKSAGKGAKEFDKSIGGALQRFKFWDTFLGTLSAMFTFQLLNAVTLFFQGAIQQAEQFKAAMVQLNFSESILSKKGMDITRQELDGFVADVESKFKYLSKLQSTKIVSETFGMLDEFDVSKENMQGLAESIAFIQLQQKLLGEESADAGSILNAAMDARSNYFNRLGVNITETLVKEKAYAMGLAKTGEELSKQERTQAVIALLIEQTTGKTDDLIEAIENTNPALAKQMKMQKDWEDALLRAGQAIEPVKKALLDLWYSIIGDGAADQAMSWFESFTAFLSSLIQTISLLVSALKEINSVWWEFVETISGGAVSEEKFLKRLKGVPETFKQINIVLKTTIDLMDEWEGGITQEEKAAAFKRAKNEIYTPNVPDTPTSIGTQAGMIEGQTKEEARNIEEAFAELRDKIEEENRKLEQEQFEAKIDLEIKLEDIDIKYADKVEDIIREYNQNIEDAVKDYNQTVSEINADYQSQVAEATASFQQEQLQAEQDFQNEMLKLKEDYLMDLEDALHERDARQVLRLMKEYQLNKTQATRDHQLEMAQNAAEFQQEMAQMAAEKAQRLEEARIEHEQKLEELQIAKERELEEANLWREREREEAYRDYQRKMAYLQRQYQQELQLLAQKLREEFNLTAQQAQALNNMLSGNLSAYSQYAQAMVSQTNAAIAQMNAGAGGGVPSGGGGTPTSTTTTNTPATLLSGALGAGSGSAPGSTGLSSNPSFMRGLLGSMLGVVPTVWDSPVWDSLRNFLGLAEGGTVIANGPTPIMMGERGPEMATFLPLNRTGKNIDKIFGNTDLLGQGGGGQVTIALDLSPDLEGRIVANSLDQMATVVMHTRMRKG